MPGLVALEQPRGSKFKDRRFHRVERGIAPRTYERHARSTAASVPGNRQWPLDRAGLPLACCSVPSVSRIGRLDSPYREESPFRSLRGRDPEWCGRCPTKVARGHSPGVDSTRPHRTRSRRNSLLFRRPSCKGRRMGMRSEAPSFAYRLHGTGGARSWPARAPSTADEKSTSIVGRGVSRARRHPEPSSRSASSRRDQAVRLFPLLHSQRCPCLGACQPLCQPSSRLGLGQRRKSPHVRAAEEPPAVQPPARKNPSARRRGLPAAVRSPSIRPARPYRGDRYQSAPIFFARAASSAAKSSSFTNFPCCQSISTRSP